MQPGRWLGALRDRDFRLYFVGQLTSAVGTGMTSVALSFAVLATHASASAVGWVLAAQSVPLALFLLVGGVVADRLGRRRVMVAADMLRGVAQALLGVWVVVGHPPLWGFIVLAAAVGSGTAFFVPAITGLIPAVVREEHLSQANALNGLSYSIGSLLGPAVAGIVIAVASPGWALLADAASYGVSIVTLGALRSPGVATAPEARASFARELRVGWHEFWSRTWLWVIVVQWSIGNAVILAPYFVLGAVVSRQSLGGASAWGAILACQGAGAILGGIVMLRLRPRRPLLVATLGAALFPWSLLALAFAAPVPVIAAGSVMGGVELAVFGVLWSTTMQQQVPREVISRVSAYDWFGTLVFLPVGYAIVGPVAAVIGVRSTFVAASIYCFASTAAVCAVPAVRRLQWRRSVATTSPPDAVPGAAT